ncbi:MAG: hypothetical protein ABL868_02270 [Sulfuriferula sp.]
MSKTIPDFASEAEERACWETRLYRVCELGSSAARGIANYYVLSQLTPQAALAALFPNHSELRVAWQCA